MAKAWHYVGALAIVIAGVWIATAIANPLSKINTGGGS
jgi:hypothetical protein